MSEAVFDSWHPERRAPRIRRRGSTRLFGFGLLAILPVVGLVGLSSLVPTPPPAAPPAHARPTWLEIPKPVQIYSLQAPAVVALPATYTARRLSSGTIREDLLTFGTPAGDAAAMRLKISRRGTEPYSPTPLFASVARQAADVGLSIDHSGLPDLMPTRFGRFEALDVTLSGAGLAGASAAKRPCTGFRLAVADPEMTIAGLACGANDQPVARGDLACLVDRLDLASAGEDKPLAAFFAKAELKRNGECAGMRLGPDGLHAAWLDDKPATARKSLRRR